MMHYCKVIVSLPLLVILLLCGNSFAEAPAQAEASIKTETPTKAKNQQEKLMQYAGDWYSADNPTDTKLGKNPSIKMRVIPAMSNSSLQVEVYRRGEKNEWKMFLLELISYDSTTDQIVAAGQNEKYECFVGRGFFDDKNNWYMQDTDHNGKITMHVKFEFLGTDAVYLEGSLPNPADNWKVKYIRAKK
jgi:hypothetical protein